MKQAKHCNLCEHPKRDLKFGLKCGISNQKPDFENFCSDIKFSDSFKKNLSELLDKIEQERKRKTSVYIQVFVMSGFALLIMFGAYPLLKKIFGMEFDYSAWKRFENVAVFYLIGSIMFSLAIWSLNKHRVRLRKLKSEKREINKVLKSYNLDINYFSRQ